MQGTPAKTGWVFPHGRAYMYHSPGPVSGSRVEGVHNLRHSATTLEPVRLNQSHAEKATVRLNQWGGCQGHGRGRTAGEGRGTGREGAATVWANAQHHPLPSQTRLRRTQAGYTHTFSLFRNWAPDRMIPTLLGVAPSMVGVIPSMPGVVAHLPAVKAGCPNRPRGSSFHERDAGRRASR